ncbi:Membrane carboxypeptidase (penicillin-binding protein) [Geodermatophilus siccatus]|uniref:Membrane carboxypeptidase (Penicillin-binding protein) n=1 Tax=Geodermatophilus siccatus TaxID=1137991 RepID=A0A1G9WEM5_9ACTN|nr:transglycosylase domain-containing protein [Geodermatophilus siccatus]SDM83002.1 Membrane carboxypeptidase (penicillin-binding protein) [Geodermatophilus siccatus]
MPPHDETSPVGPRSGSVRRPPSGRTAGGGGGGGRPPAGRGGRPPAGRGGRTTATRGAAASGTSRTGAATTGGTRPAGKAVRTKKQRRHRRLKALGAAFAGMLVLLGVFVGVVYATTEVPDPSSVQNAQTTVVYYADGTTEMARLGVDGGNRTNVDLTEVSEPAREAILAAENRNFYSDPGISFTGIVRAAWNNFTGGSTQGGSTITQQYVKNAFLTSEQTFSRKFQELFLAVKLDNEYAKDDILENYLNTIYFGRGAYGIESAANTYFGVPASQLTAQQGAVLAVLVRSPSTYDPESNPEGSMDRWGLVLDAMVDEGWLTEEERQASVFPPVLPRTGSNLGIPDGPEGLVVQRAIAELEAKGYDEQQIRAGGLRITTTVDKRYQDAAISAVDDVMDGQPDNLREALVSIDPNTGAVRAYYGGPIGAGDGAVDYAQALRQPGSSVKPYVLATALEDGISVNARRDGSSPQEFPDRPGLPVRNSGGASCGSCTLMEALTRSLNTTYYGLAYEVGAERVRQNILEATGLPEAWPDEPAYGVLGGSNTLADPQTGGTGASIGIGQYEMRPIDQAHGFATLATGVEHEPYFVARVTDSEGAVLLDYNGDAGDQVFEENVVNDVTYAMTDVAAYSRRSLDGGREVASKTGTQGQGEDNSDAWMVGFTPSISTAVWMGNDSPAQPIEDVNGRIIYGSGLPGAIWQEFMDDVLDGTPEEDLPDRALIRGDTGNGVPAPQTETRTQAPTQVTAAPTQQAEPTQTATATPTPSTPVTPTTPSTPTTQPPAQSPTQSTGGFTPPFVPGNTPVQPPNGTGAANGSNGQQNG